MKSLLLLEPPSERKFSRNTTIFSPSESLWSILNKVMTLNGSTLREILIPILNCKYATVAKSLSKWDLYKFDKININKLSKLTGLSDEALYDKIIYEIIESHGLGDKYLKYCSKCLQSGFHSIYHQLVMLDYCPYHIYKLSNKCQVCSEKIRYNFFMLNKKIPYACPLCNNLINKKSIDIYGVDCSRNYKSINYRKWFVLFDKFVLDHNKNAKWIAKNEIYEFGIENVNLLTNYLSSIFTTKPLFEAKPLLNTKHIFYRTNDRVKKYNLSEVSIYKSVKRYIKKRFLKEHKKCVKYICDRSYYNLLSKRFLQSEKVGCTIGHAFIIWRMYWENIDDKFSLCDTYMRSYKNVYRNIFSESREIENWINGRAVCLEFYWTFIEALKIANWCEGFYVKSFESPVILKRLVPYWIAKKSEEESEISFHVWPTKESLTDFAVEYSSIHFEMLKQLVQSNTNESYEFLKNTGMSI